MRRVLEVASPGAAGTSPVSGRREGRAAAHPNRALAWAELPRLPALFTVPGDVLSGAASTAVRPNSRTLPAIGSSLCLYEAGMALNDWADRDEDATERPHRPLPSGRIRPVAALTAACALTAVGPALAARAGRPALAVAAPLAATVWACALALKHTPAGPVAMAAARGLDLLLGAAATTGRTREALPSAALLGTHTLAVTTVSRQETRGGSPLPPLAALATTALLTRLLTHRPTPRPPAGRRAAAALGLPGTTADAVAAAPVGPERSGTAAGTHTFGPAGRRRPGPAQANGLPGNRPDTSAIPGPPTPSPTTSDILRTALAAAYAASTARPCLHAALNPSPRLTQRAVGGGIRATIPLQAALTARSGTRVSALLIAGLAPLGRKFARKVSVT